MHTIAVARIGGYLMTRSGRACLETLRWGFKKVPREVWLFFILAMGVATCASAQTNNVPQHCTKLEKCAPSPELVTDSLVYDAKFILGAYAPAISFMVPQDGRAQFRVLCVEVRVSCMVVGMRTIPPEGSEVRVALEKFGAMFGPRGGFAGWLPPGIPPRDQDIPILFDVISMTKDLETGAPVASFYATREGVDKWKFDVKFERGTFRVVRAEFTSYR